ncbi:SDR family oxidoreductase [Kerstersia similis]|uniref:SDR family oxidoreductase n=1 Tax=Kerstersia similis TaxID=206505 RepID=UPI0039EF8E92
MTQDKKGRVALIAGAAGGIGVAVAQRLAGEGAVLALLDRESEKVEALAERLPGSLALSCDLTDEAEVGRAVEQVARHFGRLDILVHSVGLIGASLAVHELPVEDWDRIMAVNLRSAFLCSRAVVMPMLRHDYGRIVHIASIAGKEGNAQQSAYSAAKAGVMALVKSQGKELALTGIRVNGVAPAVIQTPLADQMTPAVKAAVLSRIPMGRPGEPREVAALVSWLASTECSFSTGATFDLSGGRATF